MLDRAHRGMRWVLQMCCFSLSREEVKDALSTAGVMDGKTLISCVNPFGPKGLEIGLNSSAAEEISWLVPGAAVVEALIRYLRPFFIPASRS
jgi:hypothetical protein